MKDENWYPLETSAKIYPAILSPRQPNVYRLACVLTEEIDPQILQEALNLTMTRYPSFCVNLKAGVFWFFFQETDKKLKLRPETDYPCRMIDPTDEEGFLFRVLWYKRRISLEVFHVIADGTGGMEFLKTLVYYYLLLSGKPVKPGDNIRTLETKPTAEESENSFLRYYDPAIAPDRKDFKALHYEGTVLPHDGYRAINCSVPTESLVELAHRYHATVTEYLAALLLRSFCRVLPEPDDKSSLIRISIPINLRKVLPSDTLRNFTYFANVGVPYSRAGDSLESLLATVQEQMHDANRKEAILPRINPNVSAEQNPFLKLAPRGLKQIVLRQAHHVLGDELFTSSLSNMGLIRLDDSLNDYIDRFEFALSTSDRIPLWLSMLSFKDSMNLTFSSTIKEKLVEREFIRGLSAEIDGIVVYTNENEEGGIR